MNDKHDKSSSQKSRVTVHIVPLKVLAAVWLSLMVLTVITVAVTYVDLGTFNLYLAMLIATVKATLVALYFMHLRYDRPFHGVIFLIALAFVFLFISIVMTDRAEYQPDIDKRQEELLQSE